jgi:hemerythrin-like domain-containing protein
MKEEPAMTSEDIDTIHWLRNEHKIIRILSDELQQTIKVIPRLNRDEWLGGLRMRFARFRTHLLNHFDAEEIGGFLLPVVELRPTLSAEVDHLKHEHAELSRWLDQIIAELSDIRLDDDLLIEDTCHRIEHLLSALKHHEEHENLLVTFVFSTDIGSKD